uniref:GATA zinc finger domain-containing protein 14-like n=1 Tax=Osmia lignaria TaxID=473952 RepID=UPI0014782C34|nr:GATA zinc finger domain-containing protein 14-like [Osmia lignaria]
MAQLTFDQFKMRLSVWRDAIPMYEGGTRLLSHFIQTCDKFSENLTTNDNAINESLYALIKSKLRGEALDLVVVNKPIDWPHCRTLLINRYSDPSSEELLFNRLSTCYQQSNQTYEEYADEIKNRLNKLKDHIQLNNQDNNIIAMKNNFYNNTAENVFTNGIKQPYHSHLTHFELTDIEDCLTKCRKYDNHEQQAAFLTFMRQRENRPKTSTFNTAGISRNTNLFTHGTSGNINPFQQRAAIAQKPFAPINFGNSNNYRPNSNQPRNQNPQPTPMSISTRNTNRPNNNLNRPNNNFIQPSNNFMARPNNFFRSTGPPNFVAEELHHQEEQQQNLENQEEVNHENFPQDPDTNQEI